jgi:cysteine desulfurase
MSQPVYLDFAAATPVDSAALKSMEPYFAEQFYNPSAIYQPARNVRATVEKARGQVASVLGSKDQEIIFTAGGTEANNLAIKGVMDQFSDGHMIVSAIEHESVLEPARQYDMSVAQVSNKGLTDAENVKSLIRDETVLISVMYANNEIGTVQPIKALSELVNGVRTQRKASGNKNPLYLHTDACQASNYLDLQVTRLGVDLMTLNGGKIYGVKQSGCLYKHKSVTLKPLIYGGGQEMGLRSGTENVTALLSFATMLQKVQSDRKLQGEKQMLLINKLYATLSQKLPDIFLNGHPDKRLPNNLNVCIPHLDGERLVLELDEAGVLAATGSACTASNDEPSHVLMALGLTEEEANSSLRLTIGRTTTEEDIQKASGIIVDCVQKVQKLVQ